MQKIKASEYQALLAEIAKEERTAKKHQYSNVNAGYREDLGVSVASTMEANIFRYYLWLKGIGEIREVLYEPATFEFHKVRHGITRYTPDFWILERDFSSYFLETKGYMDRASNTKIKRFRKYYPWYKLRVMKWDEYLAIAVKAKKIIKGWEDGSN